MCPWSRHLLTCSVFLFLPFFFLQQLQLPTTRSSVMFSGHMPSSSSFLYISFSFLCLFSVYICVHVCTYTHVQITTTCKDQRVILQLYGRCFASSTILLPGIEFRMSGLVAVTLPFEPCLRSFLHIFEH